MEKVGDFQSSSERVTPISNEMKKPRRLLMVQVEPSEMCLEKIKGVLEKHKETHDIRTFYGMSLGIVMVSGYFDTGKLKMELENEMGDEIKSITESNDSVSFQSCMVPEMRVPEAADSRTEIINHSEVTTERWGRGVMTIKPEKEAAGGSGFPKMLAAEVPGSHTENLNPSDQITMKRRKNNRWWRRGVMTIKPGKGGAGGSRFPEMLAAEVPDSYTEILDHTEKN